MSGTSLDGVDAAAVRLEGGEERPDEAELLAFRSRPYEDAFRHRLASACETGGPAELCGLDAELGRRLGRAARELMEEAGLAPEEVAAVGSHGQTVWHAPPDGRGRTGRGPRDGHAVPDPDPGSGTASPCTLQLGQPAEIAEASGLAVVADFRPRDVAVGGQGAPLAPHFDRLVLRGEGARAIQNLGGMGNVTALPPRGSDHEPLAFDTGPGVALVDAAVQAITGGDERFDRDGRRAAEGRVLDGALEAWLEDPFFEAPPPKSTGRERFGPRRLEGWLADHDDAAPEDLLATLTELTARSVARGLAWVEFEVEELVLCGGGARNVDLARRIADRVDPVEVRDLSELGWDPDAREAAAFALLARQHLLGHPSSETWATGARERRVLGCLTPA
jgi:anhydro-N-acetylmuramic acid kinase